MMQIGSLLFALVFSFQLFSAPAPGAIQSNRNSNEPKVIGDWDGILSAGATQLRVVFHVLKSETDSLTATMDSPDQGAAGIPVSGVTVDGPNVRFDVEAVAGFYEGSSPRTVRLLKAPGRKAA